MRIDVKYTRVLFGFIMGSLTSVIISAVLTLVNYGAVDFPIHWLKNWLIALSIAVPIATFVPPIISKKLTKITDSAIRNIE